MTNLPVTNLPVSNSPVINCHANNVGFKICSGPRPASGPRGASDVIRPLRVCVGDEIYWQSLEQYFLIELHYFGTHTSVHKGSGTRV